MRGRKINKIQDVKMFEHNRLIEYTKMVKESNTPSGVRMLRHKPYSMDMRGE